MSKDRYLKGQEAYEMAVALSPGQEIPPLPDGHVLVIVKFTTGGWIKAAMPEDSDELNRFHPRKDGVGILEVYNDYTLFEMNLNDLKVFGTERWDGGPLIWGSKKEEEK